MSATKIQTPTSADPNTTFAPAKPESLCMWCDQGAEWTVTDRYGWVDWACQDHLVEHFETA